MAETLSSFQMQFGAPAPNFTLPDAHGALHTRDEVAGSRGLLVVFACNHCPFVVHLARALGDFAREIAPLLVNTVAINSNDLSRYPQDCPEQMRSFAHDQAWDFPYLLDETQEVAKAFGAVCTPDFFLFNAAGTLFYAGQFDDSRPKNGETPHAGDLREAVRRMLANESPLVRPYPSSGCNIKWKLA
jgi:peroxiredoxin